jgi:hypothetical protein
VVTFGKLDNNPYLCIITIKQQQAMKNSTNKLTISKEVILKAEKKARRDAEIATGNFNAHVKHKVFKSKKAYTRKDKHQKSFV